MILVDYGLLCGQQQQRPGLSKRGENYGQIIYCLLKAIKLSLYYLGVIFHAQHTRNWMQNNRVGHG